MPGQPGKNVVIAYKAESTFGVAVSGAGGTVFRANPGPGLKLVRDTVASGEFRSDAQRPMARLGHKKVSGSHVGDLSIGTFDGLIQGVMRNVFDTTLIVSNSTITSITIATNAIVSAGTGSFITANLKVGDVFRLTGTVPAGDTGINLGPITAITTSTITVPQTLTVLATAAATFTITRSPKVINPLGALAGTSPFTRASFTIEEYQSDLDDSELFVGCRVSGLKFTFPANGMVTCEFSFIGADMQVPGPAAAPNFTSPTLSTAIGLVAVDAQIRFAGGSITTLTSAVVDIQLNAADLSVIGSVTTPDVFENTCSVNVQLTGLRNDMTQVTGYLAETEVDLHLLCQTPTGAPKSFFAVYVPRLKRVSADAAQLGGDGALTETISCYAAIQNVTTGFDTTTVSIQSGP